MKASTWGLIIVVLLASAAVVKAADEFNCPKGQFWRNDDYNPYSEPGTLRRMLFVTKFFSNLRSFTIIGQTDFECVVKSEIRTQGSIASDSDCELSPPRYPNGRQTMRAPLA